jgi:predicted metal-dependent enzyme (double-stranded beta helix superfamily)
MTVPQIESPEPILDETTLSAIADGIAAADPLAFVPDGDRRRWSLVVRHEQYEAWVIAWPAGTGLAMHDHDGSRAAVAVVAGTLRERYATDAETRVRWWSPGDRHVLPHDHVHEVINLGSEEAISVHVYSPPIANIGFRNDPEIDLRP